MKKQHFKSTLAFAAWIALERANNNTYQFEFEDSGWDGTSHSTRRGLRIMQSGDESNLPQARALLNKFQDRIEVPSRSWSHDIAGAFPDVPAYLAGEVENMWQLKPDMSDRTPLRIYVGLTSSAGVDADTLVKRGCTLAAFALAMSNTRPVYITPYVVLGAYHSRRGDALISWDIQTSPLVMSELLGCTTNPSVTRYVGIEACRLLNNEAEGAWPSCYDDEALMRKHLGAKPEDLYLPSIHLYDPLVQNPEKWIKEQLDHYSQEIAA